MKNKISKDNPFKHNRYGFAWEILINRSKRHLDYGCYDGRFCEQLALSNPDTDVFGVDINTDAIEAARKRNHQNLRFELLTKGEPTRFPGEYFDTVTLLDVLEHIADQAGLLEELNRVLKTGGKLIVTVPRKHIFSFLDLGNYKFKFPNLHKVYFSFRYGKKLYVERYVTGVDGMIGDIEIEKGRHQHFYNKELVDLLESEGFCPIHMDGSGFFQRVVNLFRNIPLMDNIDGVMENIVDLDRKMFQSANIYAVFEKPIL